MPRQRDQGIRDTEMLVVEAGRAQSLPDRLAIEAPLEIVLDLDGEERPLAVTMRTPGDDEALLAGFLFAEGVITAAEDLAELRRSPGPDGAPLPNRLTVRLRPGLEPPTDHLDRHFFTTSACGLCGRTSLEGMAAPHGRPPAGPRLVPDRLTDMPERMRAAQKTFQSTGGLHAAALFDPAGELLDLAEDVGRHNALDKLIGRALLAGALPLGDRLVLVSGRASYELVQKALAAGCPALAAVSAPSSLAVATAREHGMTLIAFLRGGRFNVYSGVERLTLSPRDGR